MPKRSVLMALGAVVIFATAVPAFDGHKRGFVLGFGLGGAGASVREEIAGTSHGDTGWKGRGSVLSDLTIGGGVNDRLLIYYRSHVAWFAFRDARDERRTVTQGLAGLGLSFALAPQAPTAYLHGGLGFSSWSHPAEEDGEVRTGSGIWGGAGFEFSRHWQIEGTFGYGDPSREKGGIEITDRAVTAGITFQYLAY
jgi:Outer membrane protein beta-barrel domain